MNNNLLLIGTGGAGNKLLNTFLKIDDSYDAIFVNSNANEVKDLDMCKNDMRLIISGGGTGRDRKTAVKHLTESTAKVFEFMSSKTELYTCYTILASMDGGFGSGSVPMLCKAIKRLKADAKVGVVLTFPSFKAKKLSLENAADCYNDILELKNDGFVESITFIDNNKMKDEDEFNELTMELLHNSFNLMRGSIDLTDTMITNFATGYKLPLSLSSEADCHEEALEYAKYDSPFLVPKGWKCTHMLTTVMEDNFSKNEFSDLIDAREFEKTEYNNDELNFVLMSGCRVPSEPFRKIEKKIEEIVQSIEEDDDEDEFLVRRAMTKSKSKMEEESKPEPKQEPKISKRDLKKKIIKSLWD